jgi:hypothetical protein
LCLLAVVVLYAPLAGAAWSSHAMACCTADHCNIPQHHHRKAPVGPASETNCGHDMSGLIACSMSCCEDPDKPVVTAIAFLLPPLAFTSAPMLVTRAVEATHSIEIPRSVQPLSPPPRVAAAAL